MPDRSKPPSGPVEEFSGPERLAARVVDPGPPVRAHGYDVVSDLCAHYSFAEVVLLLLTGELPRAEDALVFEVALVYWSGATVREAPVHAAVLARLCGGSIVGTLGVGAMGLASQAEFDADEIVALESWLRSGGSFPEILRARTDTERTAARELRAALEARGYTHRVFHEDPTPNAIARSVLRSCGLKTAEQQAVAWCLGRLPALAAEALAVKPKDLASYPMRLPDYQYTELEESRDGGDQEP